MPLQNRVDPHGTIFRSPARGTFLGNRGGALHNDRREIVRAYTNRRWITCVLQFKGRHREVMTPGRYTELFFLDEATSFAAGHRPCAECRRARFNAFREAWGGGPDLRAPQMDAVLHAARVDSRGGKVTFEAPLGSLPDGCYVEIEGGAWLLSGEWLLRWTAEGYGTREARADSMVTVLTPLPTVECFRRGYRPEIHASGGEGSGIRD
jgi:hypothetical protein